MPVNRRFIAPIIASLSLCGGAAWAHEVTSKGVTVAHPWARATPEGANVGAAYMEVKTEAGVTDRLLSASTPVAGRVEIHTHIMDGDVMKMRKVDAVALVAGKSHVLKPMGDHVMLFDLKQPLKEGDLLKMTLVFEKAGPIEVEASVEPIGAKGPHGMDAQPTADGEKSGKEDHTGHGQH